MHSAVAVIDLAPRKRDQNFALRFAGWFTAPADGLDTFHTTSDDGSRLWIGDTLVVDNDGAHAAQTRSGRIVHLGIVPTESQKDIAVAGSRGSPGNCLA